MRDSGVNNVPTYYNQFVDLSDTFPLKGRNKPKYNNLQIKIASKKLPPDFFRPFTREHPNTYTQVQKQDGLKTPCFGQNQRQSNSLSLIPKQKVYQQFERSRIITLPVQQYTGNLDQIRRNLTRQHKRKQQFNSHRISNSKQLNRAHQHGSTQRQKIRYKKNTLNDDIYLEQKKSQNLQYQNRIRLNIKKFFKDVNEKIFPQFAQPGNLIVTNGSKSGRKPATQLQKLFPQELPTKLKLKKLPPLL